MRVVGDQLFGTKLSLWHARLHERTSQGHNAGSTRGDRASTFSKSARMQGLFLWEDLHKTGMGRKVSGYTPNAKCLKGALFLPFVF